MQKNCFLSRKRYQYVKACLYNSKPGQLLSTEIYKHKYLFLDGGKKTCWRKIEKLLLVVLPSFLHAKQLLMKFLTESLKLNANQLLGLLSAKFFRNRCVKPSLTFFKSVEFRSRDKRIHTSAKQDRGFECMVMSYFQRTRPD